MSTVIAAWKLSLRAVVLFCLLFLVLALGSANGKEFASAVGDQLAANFSAVEWNHAPDAWVRQETDNYLIHVQGATNQEQADIAAACEACLGILRKHWDVSDVPSWSPKCVVVLHRTPESYVGALGTRAQRSWGCATIHRNRGVITCRRIDICATTPKRLAETFAHELVHIILADYFASRSVPRWLDEGLAVLAEPSHKIAQRTDALDTDSPLVRSMELLSTVRSSTAKSQELFYAESACLVRVLLRDGDISRLLRFAQQGVRSGYDVALRDHYGIDGLLELDQRRKEHRTADLVVQASRERGTAQSR